MGTMRKMEDPPTEEKATVATETNVGNNNHHHHNTESYSIVDKDTSNGQEWRSDRRKELKAKDDHQQHYQREISNGRKQKRRKGKRLDIQGNLQRGNDHDFKQVEKETEEEKYIDEDTVGHRSEHIDDENETECFNGMGDAPIDLSKRTLNDEPQKKFQCKRVNGDAICDTRLISRDDDNNDGLATNEPLNLSRNGCSNQGRRYPPPSVSSLSSTSYHRHSCSRPNSAVHSKLYSSTSGSTESLQKRVRLEEMVSYIRRCSTADGRRRGVLDDGCPLSLSNCCDLDTNDAGGRLGVRTASCDLTQCMWESQESCSPVLPRTVIKRSSDSCFGQNTSPVTPPSPYLHHRHSHRRKSAVPYRGVAPPSKKSKRSRPVLPPEDFPKDLRTTPYSNNTTTSSSTTTTPGNPKENIGSVSYPVLRQQLLGLDASPRRTGMLSRTRSNGSGEDEENEYAVDDDDDDDDVRSLVGANRKDDGKDDDDEKGSEDDDVRDGAGDEDLLVQHHQTRLSSSSSPITSAQGVTPSRFPWNAYAYYANLFQELQGSFSSPSQSANVVSSNVSYPLSLTLIPSENRAESPASDDGTDVTSPTISAPGMVVVDCGSTDNSTNSASAGFRKRAPRALTGKHVKHGTGASPATLLTLRQKIEQKRRQQQQHNHHVPLHHQGKNGQSTTLTLRTDRKSTENNGITKALKTSSSSLSQKKSKATMS